MTKHISKVNLKKWILAKIEWVGGGYGVYRYTRNSLTIWVVTKAGRVHGISTVRSVANTLFN